MLASNRVECCPERFQMQAATANLLNTFVRDRKIYRDAMSEGLGVIEMSNPKAKTEIQDLVREII
jgi:cellulose biosynthesis protein BcsQ